MTMKTLKVIHIIGGGEYGGAEDHIIHLLKQLKERNIEPQVVCFYDALFSKRLREAGIQVTVLDYKRFDLRLFKAIRLILEKENPDVVHTHGVKANFFGRIAAGKAKVPLLVTTIHSLLRYDYENPVSYRLAKLLEDATRKRSDYFVAISHTIEKELAKSHVPSDKIQLISHGIDTERFSPKPDEASEQLELEWKDGDKEKTLIGAVGRLQDVKGLNYFIDACAKLEEERPDACRFVLIGDGPNRTELEQLVKKRKLEHSFRFAGFREDVDQCLNALDIYVSSSLSEGLGLAVMEALATGTPVIATGVGGVTDFAVHEKNALVINSEKSGEITASLKRLMDDPALAKRISEQGVKDIQQQYSLDKMGEETTAYYRKWLKEISR